MLKGGLGSRKWLNMTTICGIYMFRGRKFGLWYVKDQLVGNNCIGDNLCNNVGWMWLLSEELFTGLTQCI